MEGALQRDSATEVQHGSGQELHKSEFSSKLRAVALMALGLVPVLFGTTACTDNEMAKNFGGTMTVDLDAGKKLENVTWKENELWLLTRDMRPGENAEKWEFNEKSSYGVLEGTIKINEHGSPEVGLTK